MKRAAIAVVLMACAGCWAQTETTRAASVDVKELAVYAANHHIRWKVICVGTDDDHYYLGWAIPAGGKFSLFIEDGAKPDWTVVSPTQAEAVQKLMVAITYMPNNYPQHIPAPKTPSKRTKCLTELNSENYSLRCKGCSKP